MTALQGQQAPDFELETGDGDGVIRWRYVSPVDVNPGADGILEALEALTAEAHT